LTETVDQGTLASQACNVNRKAGAIQSIGGINELPFRPANIEIVDELQNSYAIWTIGSHKHCRSVTPARRISFDCVQTLFQWNRHFEIAVTDCRWPPIFRLF
jgi:hypothetical protein